jgi:hypothetical protein
LISFKERKFLCGLDQALPASSSLNGIRVTRIGGREAPTTLWPGYDPVTCSGRTQRRRVDYLPYAANRDVPEMNEYQGNRSHHQRMEASPE